MTSERASTRVSVRRRWLRRAPATATVLVALVTPVLAGCGGEADEGTQPAPVPTAFTTGDFDDLPRLPASEAVSPPNVTAGVTAQSFTVGGATPETVLTWYVDRLDPATWRVVETPQAGPSGSWRGVWESDEHRLEVAAVRLGEAQGATTAPGGTVPTGLEARTQYSLLLSGE